MGARLQRSRCFPSPGSNAQLAVPVVNSLPSLPAEHRFGVALGLQTADSEARLAWGTSTVAYRMRTDRMGRNTAGRATYQSIIEAATDMFGEVGFDGVSIRAIGKRAGVTLGAVHHHFGGKDELYAECVSQADASLRESLYAEIGALFPRPDLEQLLSDAIALSLAFVRANNRLIRFLMRTYVQDHRRIELSRVRRQGDLLTVASKFVAKATGRDERAVRISCQALSYAIVRFASSSDEELCFIAQTTEIDDALKHIQASLLAMAMASVGPQTVI